MSLFFTCCYAYASNLMTLELRELKYVLTWVDQLLIIITFVVDTTWRLFRRDRLNAMAAQRSAEPRKGLPVNELVAAASNPNLFTQQAKGVKVPTYHQNSTAIRDSGYQSSTGSLPTSNQLHLNGPLSGSAMLSRTSPAGSTQYVAVSGWTDSC